ncbi:MerR family DNA-binding transcriptional regulator [Pseudonocardia benzenivorans]|uniref:MerR family DNA-binding transcriptional regulator n=1 Tax=Pseudonocardia benzenivorans TaxID=228005 RepID=A0ABW3VEE5_9PSEU
MSATVQQTPLSYLPPKVVADRLGVTVQTVRRYAKIGRLTRYELPSGRPRFDPREVDALLAAPQTADEQAEDEIRRYARALVDQAPPLTPAQRDRLASLLRAPATSSAA